MRALRTECVSFALAQGRLTPVPSRPGRLSNRQYNLSPVDVAVQRGDTDTLCCLLAVAPNLDILDDGGVSALLIAVQDGHPKASHGNTLFVARPPVPLFTIIRPSV